MGRWRLRGYVPFTNWFLVWKHLDKTGESILDLGCGKGNPMRFLNRHHRFYSVGLDGFEPCIRQCQSIGSHDALVPGDMRLLPFKNKSFDVVVCLQTLEHFSREEGKKLLKDMESIARKQVILTTDVGEYVQIHTLDNNPLQEHKYVWSVAELGDLDFKIFGIGLSKWGGETGLSRLLPPPLRWLFGTSLQLLVGPVVYFLPTYA